MDKFWARVLAVIACIFVYVLYIIFCTAMGFSHGGGIIVLIILFSIMRAVWKGINSMAEDTNKENEEGVPQDNTNIIAEDVTPSESEAPVITPEITLNEVEDTDLPPLPIDDSDPKEKTEVLKCAVVSTAPITVTSEQQNLPPLPSEEVVEEVVEEVTVEDIAQPVVPQDNPLESPSSSIVEEQVSSDVLKTPEKSTNNRNVLLVVLGSIVLCLALVFMIISLVEFQVIWDYASDRFRHSNWFERTSRACFMEMILFVLFSVVATIILSVQYAIFHQTKSNYSGIVWGCIELVFGLLTLPALFSSLSAIVFGTLYVVNGLKKLNYL